MRGARGRRAARATSPASAAGLAAYPGRRQRPDAGAVAARRVTRGADGALAVGGPGVRDLAAEFGTPAYVLDEDDLRVALPGLPRGLRRRADVYYAGKAFLCTGGGPR